ncbi:hypothetical protein OH77DRAFT_1518243 [Trametes cingulata]|nr:hypothetical protein OH77DRAFT_1518243 [Trametes cingulata]
MPANSIIRGRALPLDERLYTIDDEAIEFMKAQTRIQDPDELKKHILAVQGEAYEVFPYVCIRGFYFLRWATQYRDRDDGFDSNLGSLKVARLPAYQQLLALGRERQNAILLDIGCCLGSDIRKVVADGYPVKYCVASDLYPGFWDLGHKLFRSTPETFPVPFVPGDAFDSGHIERIPPFYSPPDTPVPELSTLTSLNPLRGHVSAIHASSFFHLFNEEQQFKLAQALACLLSPEPGSIILGSHVGRPEKGLRVEAGQQLSSTRAEPMFCHSPESWVELWNGQIFRQGTVKVEAVLEESRGRDREQLPDLLPETKVYSMEWSVTRL